jgi:hypothetical protein
MGAANQYHVYAGDRHRVSREIADLADRRTRPFFDHAGIDRPLSILMQEAYLQGIKDAVQAMEAQRVTLNGDQTRE